MTEEPVGEHLHLVVHTPLTPLLRLYPGGEDARAEAVVNAESILQSRVG